MAKTNAIYTTSDHPTRHPTTNLKTSFDVKKAANNNIANKQLAEWLQNRAEVNGELKASRRDQKIWGTLSDHQFKAAHKIYGGFQRLTSGAGYRTQVFSGMPGRQGRRIEDDSDLVERFSIWAKKATSEKIQIGAVLDILAFGRSCRQVDKELCKRKGFAKQNLIEGLDIYIHISWKKHL